MTAQNFASVMYSYMYMCHKPLLWAIKYATLLFRFSKILNSGTTRINILNILCLYRSKYNANGLMMPDDKYSWFDICYIRTKHKGIYIYIHTTASTTYIQYRYDEARAYTFYWRRAAAIRYTSFISYRSRWTRYQRDDALDLCCRRIVFFFVVVCLNV